MSKIYVCPICKAEYSRPIQSEAYQDQYYCTECQEPSSKSGWSGETPTPETLNKEDALRIIETYFKAGFNKADKGCILHSAINHLESLRYPNETEGGEL